MCFHPRGVDQRADAAGVDGFGIEFFVRVGDFQFSAAVAQQQFLAVGRKIEALHALFDGFGFALFEVEAIELPAASGFGLGGSFDGARRAALHQNSAPSDATFSES